MDHSLKHETALYTSDNDRQNLHFRIHYYFARL